MVDALILNYNDYETVIKNINKLTEYKSLRKILIVDNCSNDDSHDELKKYASSKIIVIKTDKNGGYGYGNNYGINYLIDKFNSKYILLLNPDTSISDNTIKKLEIFLEKHNDYAIVSPFMLNKNRKKQLNTAFEIGRKAKYILSFSIMLKYLLDGPYKKKLLNSKDDYIDVDAVTGSLFMFSAEKMQEYGMFDEGLFLYSEETALGIKMKRANQKTALLPKESFIHDHSVSIDKTYKNTIEKRKINIKSRLYILKKYYKANSIECLIAKIIGMNSYLELYIIDLMRKIKKHK